MHTQRNTLKQNCTNVLTGLNNQLLQPHTVRLFHKPLSYEWFPICLQSTAIHLSGCRALHYSGCSGCESVDNNRKVLHPLVLGCVESKMSTGIESKLITWVSQTPALTLHHQDGWSDCLLIISTNDNFKPVNFLYSVRYSTVLWGLLTLPIYLLALSKSFTISALRKQYMRGCNIFVLSLHSYFLNFGIIFHL